MSINMGVMSIHMSVMSIHMSVNINVNMSVKMSL
jgi:hypothetical protein